MKESEIAKTGVGCIMWSFLLVLFCVCEQGLLTSRKASMFLDKGVRSRVSVRLRNLVSFFQEIERGLDLEVA